MLRLAAGKNTRILNRPTVVNSETYRQEHADRGLSLFLRRSAAKKRGELPSMSEPETTDAPSVLPLAEGQVVTGTLFSEPMRVETIRESGPGTWVVGLCGISTERFRRVTLTAADLQQLQIQRPQFSYDGDGQVLRIGLQAYSLGIAYEFDPYFGLSISRVDPLPHQLEAVYDYLLKLARVRFLIADDPGAGKTIMAGLLIRELKLRGLVERILVICPANLTFQWSRELRDKFEEKFKVLKGGDIREQYGINRAR